MSFPLLSSCYVRSCHLYKSLEWQKVENDTTQLCFMYI
jgi:hypothetical protein